MSENNADDDLTYAGWLKKNVSSEDLRRLYGDDVTMGVHPSVGLVKESDVRKESRVGGYVKFIKKPPREKGIMGLPVGIEAGIKIKF